VTTLFQSLYTLAHLAVDRAGDHLAAVREEKGASAVEYALLVGLIAIAVVAAVGLFKGKLNELFNTVNVNGTATP
jgi:pilus assembly protein Flp/PilA